MHVRWPTSQVAGTLIHILCRVIHTCTLEGSVRSIPADSNTLKRDSTSSVLAMGSIPAPTWIQNSYINTSINKQYLCKPLHVGSLLHFPGVYQQIGTSASNCNQYVMRIDTCMSWKGIIPHTLIIGNERNVNPRDIGTYYFHRQTHHSMINLLK